MPPHWEWGGSLEETGLMEEDRFRYNAVPSDTDSSVMVAGGGEADRYSANGDREYVGTTASAGAGGAKIVGVDTASRIEADTSVGVIIGACTRDRCGEDTGVDPTSGVGVGIEPTSGDNVGVEPTSGDGVGIETTSGDSVGVEPTSGDSVGIEPTSGDDPGVEPTISSEANNKIREIVALSGSVHTV